MKEKIEIEIEQTKDGYYYKITASSQTVRGTTNSTLVDIDVTSSLRNVVVNLLRGKR